MSDEQTIVLVGAGQLVQRDVDPMAALEPVAMMAEAARRAAHDTGAGPRLLAKIDVVAVPNIIGWHYANPPGLLAERIDARPAESLYTTIGGNTPQWLVNALAARIVRGEVKLALIAGAEALATQARARRAGVALAWTADGTGSPTLIGDRRAGTNDHEAAHGLQLPVQIYPLFENALRAVRRSDIAAHTAMLGRLCAGLSAVAAGNPFAWFRQVRTAQEIATVSSDNRLIAFPYPKYMNAIMEVDQAAAVLLTSAATARQLGIPQSRWVYLLGAGDAHDHWWVSERTSYVSSPALRAAAVHALAQADTDISSIDFVDLYSCFPSAVQVARDAVGIGESDPRPLTVTGGLPYAGGPGNNYVTHAIAAMMKALRGRPGATGLVTGLGWYITKHSVGVYGTRPPERPWAVQEDAALQQELDAAPHPPLVRQAQGRGTIETYTVLYDRDGGPVRGIVIGRLADGSRFLANTPAGRDVLEELASTEGVGRPGRVGAVAGGMNQFDPD